MYLEMKNITKVFPGVTALNDVDFSVEKGKVHALVGENGAGKSTLMKILAGAHQPTSGKILIDGHEVVIDNTRKALELGIGIIYQELNLVQNLNAFQNIFLGREFKKSLGIIDFNKELEEAERWFKSLDIDVDFSAQVGELSIAAQQLIEIVKAVSQDASIIVMDEPTDSLTLKDTENLFRIVRQLKEQGVTVIYISHRLEELFEICDSVTVLRDGELIARKQIDEVTEDDLIRLMVGRDLKEQFPARSINSGKEIFRVENLYDETGLLNDVSFSLYEGEILGFSGLVGAGRSELAHALIGSRPIKSGSIYLDGEEITIKSPSDALEMGISLAPENRKEEGLVLPLSVADNTTLSCLDRCSSKGGIIERAQEAELVVDMVDKLNIKTPHIGQKVLNLSGGNQQKVVFAKLMLSGAKVLIFDEPTRGIDVGAKKEIYNLLDNLSRQGVGIIFISSEMPEILGLSDRIVVMHRGQVTATCTREEADEEVIMSCSLGKQRMVN